MPTALRSATSRMAGTNTARLQQSWPSRRRERTQAPAGESANTPIKQHNTHLEPPADTRSNDPGIQSRQCLHRTARGANVRAHEDLLDVQIQEIGFVGDGNIDAGLQRPTEAVLEPDIGKR